MSLRHLKRGRRHANNLRRIHVIARAFRITDKVVYAAGFVIDVDVFLFAVGKGCSAFASAFDVVLVLLVVAARATKFARVTSPRVRITFWHSRAAVVGKQAHNRAQRGRLFVSLYWKTSDGKRRTFALKQHDVMSSPSVPSSKRREHRTSRQFFLLERCRKTYSSPTSSLAC